MDCGLIYKGLPLKPGRRSARSTEEDGGPGERTAFIKDQSP